MRKHALPPRTGFTTIELLVTVLVLSILAIVSYGNFRSLWLKTQLETTASKLTAHIQVARHLSISYGKRVILAPNDGQSLTSGWRVGYDQDQDGVIDSSTSLAEAEPVNDSVRVSATGSMGRAIGFNAQGWPTLPNGGFQAGTIRVCTRESGTELIMSKTGRIRTAPLTAAECA